MRPECQTGLAAVYSCVSLAAVYSWAACTSRQCNTRRESVPGTLFREWYGNVPCSAGNIPGRFRECSGNDTGINQNVHFVPGINYRFNVSKARRFITFSWHLDFGSTYADSEAFFRDIWTWIELCWLGGTFSWHLDLDRPPLTWRHFSVTFGLGSTYAGLEALFRDIWTWIDLCWLGGTFSWHFGLGSTFADSGALFRDIWALIHLRWLGGTFSWHLDLDRPVMT